MSALGDTPDSDYQALESLRTELSSANLLATVEQVVIYEAATANGEPPAACVDATATTERCHVITGVQLRAMTQGGFTANGCLDGALFANYCPTSRSTAASNPEYIGLWVRVRHEFVSGFFTDTGITVRQRAVMRMEPA